MVADLQRYTAFSGSKDGIGTSKCIKFSEALATLSLKLDEVVSRWQDSCAKATLFQSTSDGRATCHPLRTWILFLVVPSLADLVHCSCQWSNDSLPIIPILMTVFESYTPPQSLCDMFKELFIFSIWLFSGSISILQYSLYQTRFHIMFYCFLDHCHTLHLFMTCISTHIHILIHVYFLCFFSFFVQLQDLTFADVPNGLQALLKVKKGPVCLRSCVNV